MLMVEPPCPRRSPSHMDDVVRRYPVSHVTATLSQSCVYQVLYLLHLVLAALHPDLHAHSRLGLHLRPDRRPCLSRSRCSRVTVLFLIPFNHQVNMPCFVEAFVVVVYQ